jgi:hypothetical protein
VLVPGTPVVIRAGALMGMRGVVISTASGNRFVIRVNFIQQGASIVLEGSLLEQAQD